MNALGLVFLAMPFVVMLTAGLAVPFFVVMAYNSFRFGIGATILWYFCEAALLDAAGFRLGINLFYTDLFTLALGSVAGLRLLFANEFPLRHRAWLLFCAVFAFSLAAGLVSFGTGGGVSARGYFYFIVTGLYAMSFRVDEDRLVFVYRCLLLAALAFTVLVCYRWTVFYLPIKELLPERGVYNFDGEIRVVGANNALLMAQALIVGIFFAGMVKGVRWAQMLAPLLLGVVVALQHRSVWLAFLIGVVASVMIARSKTGSAFSQLMFLGVIAGGVAASIAFGGGGSALGQQIASSAVRAVQGSDTTGSRLRDWQGIIKKWYEAGPRSIAIGQAFGTDMTREIESDSGRNVRASFYAHNLYVQTLFSMGLLGLSAMVVAFGYVTIGLYRLCRMGAGPPIQLLLVLIVMQQVYYIPYGQDYFQNILFGVALAYVAGRKGEARLTTAPAPLLGMRRLA